MVLIDLPASTRTTQPTADPARPLLTTVDESDEDRILDGVLRISEVLASSATGHQERPAQHCGEASRSVMLRRSRHVADEGSGVPTLPDFDGLANRFLPLIPGAADPRAAISIRAIQRGDSMVGQPATSSLVSGTAVGTATGGWRRQRLRSASDSRPASPLSVNELAKCAQLRSTCRDWNLMWACMSAWDHSNIGPMPDSHRPVVL